MFRSLFLFMATCLFSLLIHPAPLQATASEDSLVSVNGSKITKGDLAFFMLSRNIPVEQQAKLRKQSLEILVDRKLMSDFLAKRKTTVSQKEIDAQVKRIYKLIRKKGDDPQKILQKIGFTKERLREEVLLPLSWGQQARRMISDTQLRKYYKKHQSRFNGTKVRTKHIFIKLNKEATEEELQQAEQKLLDIHKKIEAGEIIFTMAAQQHSESPSKKEGGDIGLIGYRGEMPTSFCAAAFRLKVNEVSQPVRTPFGLHLITVTEIKKGDISLEDVRVIVFNELAGELWNGLIKQQRKKATIQWHNEK